MKRLLKEVTPPCLARLLRFAIDGGKTGFTKECNTWSQAALESAGYDSDLILSKTAEALLQVRDGRAVYERDSVLFDEIQYSWPLLAGLLWVAARSDGVLKVLDFGGSLGSTYFQNRRFLTGLKALQWNIVEQAGHARVGRKLFADDVLRFYESVDLCVADTSPSVVILSAVLQHVEFPYAILDTLAAIPVKYMIIGRTPIWGGKNDRVFVQKVPARIYSASYPAWVFAEDKLLQALLRNWTVVEKYEEFGAVGTPFPAKWGGFILERRDLATEPSL